MAACVRSIEARRRVFMEISNILNDFNDLSNDFRPPDNDIQAFIDLLNDWLLDHLQLIMLRVVIYA